jgi:hypothetical protein
VGVGVGVLLVLVLVLVLVWVLMLVLVNRCKKKNALRVDSNRIRTSTEKYRQVQLEIRTLSSLSPLHRSHHRITLTTASLSLSPLHSHHTALKMSASKKCKTEHEEKKDKEATDTEPCNSLPNALIVGTGEYTTGYLGSGCFSPQNPSK